MNVKIDGLDKAEVLAELHNFQKMQKPHSLWDPNLMTIETARNVLCQTKCFDYLKLDLRSDHMFFADIYDRYNGTGAAQAAVDRVRERMEREI